jgi:peptidyl-prolyl cis-trans isomerase B (cyclophilin B)
MRRTTSVVALALASALLSSCGFEGVGATTTSTTTTTTATTTTSEVGAAVPQNYEAFRAQPTACGAAAPEPVATMRFDEPLDMGITAPTAVTLHTSCGSIEITVNPGIAPETVNSFVFLAEHGYFDGSVSHRVVPGFMMQAGDQTATGRGGPGYVIPDEFPTEGFVYDAGMVAMANAGPGTTGSQFFILFGRAAWLPPNYSVFGYVTDGFETLSTIESLPLGLDPNGPDPSPSTPLQTLYIESVVVTR